MDYTRPMSRVRRVAAPVATLWLLVQTATFVVVPAVFYLASGAPVECTCMHDGNHRDCPMHHGSPVGARVCFQSAGSDQAAALGSLLGHVGVVPAPPDSLLLSLPPLAVQQDAPTPRPATPDPPPPRA
jgi:hypothetical protein